MKIRKKRNIIIGILTVFVFLLTVAYSILSSNFSITSTSTIEGTWEVIISDINFDYGTNDAFSNSYEIDEDKLGVVVYNTFYMGGGDVVYTVTVKNTGNIDAKIRCILPSEDEYYKFSSNLKNNTLLKVNESKSFRITISFKENVSNASSELKAHEFNILAEQDDGTGIETDTTNYVYKVNPSDNVDDIGTEISIGDEHFYVIKSTNSTLTLLSKYNLLVGSTYYKDPNSGYVLSETFSYGSNDRYNLQSSNAIGSTSYSSYHVGVTIYSNNSYWGYNSDIYDNNEVDVIKEYVDNYKSLLESKYNISINSARLIKLSELLDLGCNMYSCKYDTGYSNREWIYQTTYWTGSSPSNEYVYLVNSTGEFTNAWYKNKESVGVRPVITIDKYLISN